MHRNQLSNRLRQGCCLVLSYVLLLSATVVPTFAQTGPQPGATDPAGKPDRYNIFPSHDVMAFIPEGDTVLVTPYGFDRSFNLNPLAYAYSQPYQQDSNQLFGAGGRIAVPGNAQVVYARRSGSNIDIYFHGPSSLPASTTIAGLADRLSFQAFDNGNYQMSDFIDVTAADVDKVPDASGNNH